MELLVSRALKAVCGCCSRSDLSPPPSAVRSCHSFHCPGLLEGDLGTGPSCLPGGGEGRWIECPLLFSMQTRGFKCLVVGLLGMNFVEEECICLILMHVEVRLKGDRR